MSGNSQMLIDVVERQALLNHHDLQVINLLADLLSQPFIALVLSCHPHFGGFLHDFLTDGMYSAVKLLGEALDAVYELTLATLHGDEAALDEYNRKFKVL